jgi:hypothetical protein
MSGWSEGAILDNRFYQEYEPTVPWCTVSFVNTGGCSHDFATRRSPAIPWLLSTANSAFMRIPGEVARESAMMSPTIPI